MSDTALIVIDVQAGMFALPDMQPHGGDAFLGRLRGLVTLARRDAAPVIFVQHDGGAGHPLEKPNNGWQIHAGTGYRDDDIVVEKKHCDAFQGTDLQQRLENLGVRKLVLAGMMSEYCVDTTCRRAYSLGYDVILAEDAHSTFSKADLTADQIIRHHNTVLGGGFAKVRPSASIDFQNAEIPA